MALALKHAQPYGKDVAPHLVDSVDLQLCRQTKSSYGARCHLVYRLDRCDTRVALGLSRGQWYP